MTNNTITKKNSLKIKIFEPLSNKNWLEQKVNTWLDDNPVEIIQINMTYSEDKYIFTLLYKESN
jgi:hypothetical protein